jgi:hypothetical protein
MANKDEVVAKIESLRHEIGQVVASMPEAEWSMGIYEDGWDARQTAEPHGLNQRNGGVPAKTRRLVQR